MAGCSEFQDLGLFPVCFGAISCFSLLKFVRGFAGMNEWVLPRLLGLLGVMSASCIALAAPGLAQAPEPPGDPGVGRTVAKRIRMLLADAEDFRDQEDWQRYCQAYAMIGSDINLNRNHLLAAEPAMNWDGLQQKSQRMFAFCFLQ